MERFLKDNVSEIRIGALKNLHIFLAEVKPETRHNFIKFILSNNNEESQYDWRKKLVLAQNLGKFAQLFDQETVYKSFIKMFFLFCIDNVSKVQETASTSLVYILEKFSDDLNKQEAIANVVKKNFRNANFKKRQLFIYMCGEAMTKKELFERLFKADLLSMVNDKVSNVRLALAKVLRHHFIN